jgi:hypothetical protein
MLSMHPPNAGSFLGVVATLMGFEIRRVILIARQIIQWWRSRHIASAT